MLYIFSDKKKCVPVIISPVKQEIIGMGIPGNPCFQDKTLLGRQDLTHTLEIYFLSNTVF